LGTSLRRKSTSSSSRLSGEEARRTFRPRPEYTVKFIIKKIAG